ncbi:hypothetical protein V7x_12020 [Crateriforma conspicua]|uniref:Uncharacterized protein n=1 Tax=Crateriforma conspicua TaxID=2527996 RepID=A0A5C6FTN6_9PLAN|nr:hypothetical protein V7x_12020 [Crateriforma conspicua]
MCQHRAADVLKDVGFFYVFIAKAVCDRSPRAPARPSRASRIVVFLQTDDIASRPPRPRANKPPCQAGATNFYHYFDNGLSCIHILAALQ